MNKMQRNANRSTSARLLEVNATMWVLSGVVVRYCAKSGSLEPLRGSIKQAKPVNFMVLIKLGAIHG